ncbi:hypothetical protein K490DRAFT_61053 [Saccharata proteae CBS 121410]|uniref:Uncharacterized protein n=1 Tax=Saccharata proteae CBS 121410 TaxID=1314787 RepID=A0A9P4I2Q2_9PEZI|nr:hypothetical protein K490DRAFT_61053 [Saccharata proteae CBS 121410]
MSQDKIFEAADRLSNDLLLLLLWSLIMSTQHLPFFAGYKSILAIFASAGAKMTSVVLPYVKFARCILSWVLVMMNAVHKSLLFHSLVTLTHMIGSLFFTVLYLGARKVGSVSGFQPGVLGNTNLQLRSPIISSLALASLRCFASQLRLTLCNAIQIFKDAATKVGKAVWVAILIKTFSDFYTISLDLTMLLDASEGLNYAIMWVFGTTLDTTLAVLVCLGSSTTCLVAAIGCYTIIVTTFRPQKRTAEQKKAIASAAANYNKSFEKRDETTPGVSLEEQLRACQSSHNVYKLSMEANLESRNGEIKKLLASINNLRETVSTWMSRGEDLRKQILDKATTRTDEIKGLKREILERDNTIAEKNHEIRRIKTSKQSLEIELEEEKTAVEAAQKEARDNATACADHVTGERYDKCKADLDAAHQTFGEFYQLCKELHISKADAEQATNQDKEGQISKVEADKALNQALQKQAGRKNEEISLLKKDMEKMRATIAELEAENYRLDPEIAD